MNAYLPLLHVHAHIQDIPSHMPPLVSHASGFILKLTRHKTTHIFVSEICHNFNPKQKEAYQIWGVLSMHFGNLIRNVSLHLVEKVLALVTKMAFEKLAR